MKDVTGACELIDGCSLKPQARSIENHLLPDRLVMVIYLT